MVVVAVRRSGATHPSGPLPAAVVRLLVTVGLAVVAWLLTAALSSATAAQAAGCDPGCGDQSRSSKQVGRANAVTGSGAMDGPERADSESAESPRRASARGDEHNDESNDERGDEDTGGTDPADEHDGGEHDATPYPVEATPYLGETEADPADTEQPDSSEPGSGRAGSDVTADVTDTDEADTDDEADGSSADTSCPVSSPSPTESSAEQTEARRERPAAGLLRRSGALLNAVGGTLRDTVSTVTNTTTVVLTGITQPIVTLPRPGSGTDPGGLPDLGDLTDLGGLIGSDLVPDLDLTPGLLPLSPEPGTDRSPQTNEDTEQQTPGDMPTRSAPRPAVVSVSSPVVPLVGTAFSTAHPDNPAPDVTGIRGGSTDGDGTPGPTPAAPAVPTTSGATAAASHNGADNTRGEQAVLRWTPPLAQLHMIGGLRHHDSENTTRVAALPVNTPD